MAIIGGFLGGGVEMVPAGYGQLVLQWQTPDRKNQKATFTITGTGGTFTVESNESGYAEKLVPTGNYTVSITHTGSYNGDQPIKVIVESTKSYLVFFSASLIDVSTIRFTYKDPQFYGKALEMKNSAGLVRFSGTLLSQDNEVLVSFDTYSITVEGGLNFSVKVTESGVTVVNLDDFVGKIVIDDSALPPGCSFKVDGVPLKSKTYLTTPGIHTVSTISPKYPNGTDIVSVGDISVNVVLGTNTVRPTGVGVLSVISESSDTTLYGKYNVIVVGGGGGGGAYSKSGSYGYFAGGGGGGYMEAKQVSVSGNVHITIGAGGAVQQNGGASSFGNYLSAQGGGSGSGTKGGNGNTGGGGGVYVYFGHGTNRGYDGGNGVYGGGGGGGSAGKSTQTMGKGGTSQFGGAGDPGREGMVGGAGGESATPTGIFVQMGFSKRGKSVTKEWGGAGGSSFTSFGQVGSSSGGGGAGYDDTHGRGGEGNTIGFPGAIVIQWVSR